MSYLKNKKAGVITKNRITKDISRKVGKSGDLGYYKFIAKITLTDEHLTTIRKNQSIMSS